MKRSSTTSTPIIHRKGGQALGSSNYLSDVLGEVYQHVEYLPWGETFLEERNTQTDRNTYLYTGKELDLMTGLYYYEQRYFDPNKSTFLGVDQLEEKYPSVSSYAYVANNPINAIDPDGRVIVDAKGKPITYSAKTGWSSNVTDDVMFIHRGLMLTKTGQEQWDKAYNSPNKIEMNLVNERLFGKNDEPALGLANQALVKNKLTKKVSKGDGVMKISISIPHINDSFEGKNKGLSFLEAVAATAGHEIEHTTEDNRDIGVHNATFPIAERNIEREPEGVGRQIREESRSQPDEKLSVPLEKKIGSLSNN